MTLAHLPEQSASSKSMIAIPGKGIIPCIPMVPSSSPTPGDLVLVERRGHYHTGYYLGNLPVPKPFPGSRPPYRIHDRFPYLPPDLVELLFWLSRHSQLGVEEFLASALPSPLPFSLEPQVLFELSSQERTLSRSSGAPMGLKLKAPELFMLPLEGKLSSRRKQAKGARELLPACVPPESCPFLYGFSRGGTRKGAIPLPFAPWRPPQLLPLNAEQREVVADLRGWIEKKEHALALLHGVTGSGKTEVYIALAHAAVREGRTALILVPEIALTPVLEERFRRRLGVPVEVWHSALPRGRREQILAKLLREELPVIIGAKSALFLPLRHLGLLVVDEEHDPGHTLELKRVRIGARELAAKRGEFASALVVLGSATPSLESWYAAKRKRILLSQLKTRPLGNMERTLEIVPLGDHREQGPYPWLSRRLKERIEAALAREESVILFRNRRGFHPIVECRGCQGPVPCPSCSLPLAYHRIPPQLKCHICGFTASPERCPSCRAQDTLRFFGTGTQRIEDELKGLFPGAEILRLDRDVLTSHTRLREILSAFSRGGKQILVGTQMVTKGLDFARVTCVGIVDADAHLYAPDFRSSERVFQQIAQIAGRVGRRELPGVIVIQTRYPQHPLFPRAAQEDVAPFLEEELAIRERNGYPPSKKLLRLLFMSYDPGLLPPYFQELRALLEQPGVRILGPAPAPLERAENLWRFHALLFAPNWSLLRHLLKSFHSLPPPRGTRCLLEFDPPSLS